MKKLELISYKYSILLCIALCSCGSGDLGNKLTIFEGDKLEDRVIVYCTGYSFGVCKSGIYVIPTYEEHYDEQGNYAEYLVEAESNENWVVSKTFQIKQNKENYWIIRKDFSLENVDCAEINCDSIIQSNVTGPLDYLEFGKKTKELGIEIKILKEHIKNKNK